MCDKCPARLNTGTGVVERGIQTLRNLFNANLVDRIELTEIINRGLRIMRFAIHTRFEVSQVEPHHGRKTRTELNFIIKDNKSYLSDWTTLNVSVPLKQIPIYVAPNVKGEVRTI